MRVWEGVAAEDGACLCLSHDQWRNHVVSVEREMYVLVSCFFLAGEMGWGSMVCDIEGRVRHVTRAAASILLIDRI